MTRNLYTTGRLAAYLVCLVFFLSHCILSSAQVIVTYAGNGAYASGGDNGPATAASFKEPTCLTLDDANNLYINDLLSNRVRKVNVAGVISMFAGTGVVPGYGGDNGPATAAKLSSNWGVAKFGSGYVLVTDINNSRLRRVDPAGIIMTIAGTGVSNYSGDGGPASSAELQAPKGVAVDGLGNVYVSGESKIRKINNSGGISLFAGYGLPGMTYGYSGDGGPATQAKLSNIFGMATDAAGNLYVCDASNNVIRKVSTTGIITTIAGNGTAGFGGDGGQATAAKLNYPTGVFVSHTTGEIYIADHDNNRIRKITTAGIISTIAGTGVPGFSGDNGPATAAQLNQPSSVIVDANDNIYVADQKNNRVRKIIKSIAFTGSPSQNLSVCMNSGATPINSLLSVQDYSTGLTDTWTQFTAPAHGSVSGSYSTSSTGGVLTPAGLYYTPLPGYYGTDNFKIKVSNSSASDIITINVMISPLTLSAGTITGSDSSVCLGAAITLSNAVTGGAWSSSNNNATETNITGGQLEVKGAHAPGLDTIRYTVSNACGTASTMKVITVNPLPTPGLISGATGVCVGKSTTLGASVAGGTWGQNNAIVSITPFPGGGAVFGLNAGSVVIQYTVWNTWCPAITNHILYVETFPHADAITGAASVCVGSEVSLEDAMPSGTWTISNAGDASITPIYQPKYGLCIVKGLSAGAATITYEITNSCGSDHVTKDITVHPLPEVPTITRNDAVLSVRSDYSAYQWLTDGREIPGAVYDTCSVGSDGFYTVKVANVHGCSVLSPTYRFTGCDPAEMDIFPNPTFSKVYVRWCRSVDARVVAADGRTVAVLPNVNEIDLDHLPPGPYMLSFYDSKGNKVRSQKVEKLP